MTDFNPGQQAPDFTLGDFQLSQTLKKGPVLLTFYKKTCPTCQLSYPFFEKLHKAYHGASFQVIGIGQDPETKEFSNTYGITFPMISDTASYDVSKQYHLTTVPTVFLVMPSGKIDTVSVGFSKSDLSDLTQRLSKLIHKDPIDLFQGTNAPDTKPG